MPDLATFRQVIADLCRQGDLASIRRRAVIVPSRAAAEQIRRGLEDDALGAGVGAVVLPHLVTRDEWMDMLVAGVDAGRRRLSAIEREVLLGAAAREALEAGAAPPFTLRPGLVARMTEFYDGLRRHLRTIDDFERVVIAALERDVDTDRGAVRMLEQTRFLVAAFRAYEARLDAMAAADEHAARRELVDGPESVFSHVVVAVGDRGGDPAGLWPADFDLLTRIAGLERLDLVATDAVLASGFLPRIRLTLPGLDEVTEATASLGPGPHLVAPDEPDGPAFWRFRDREDELSETVRRVRQGAREEPGLPLSRTAVVYKRPLPYVYLARQIFPGAGVPFQTFDALPLAAEPYAALLDLVIECVESDGSRAAVVALLRSPLLRFEVDGHRIGAAATARVDRALAEARYLAGTGDLERLVSTWVSSFDAGGDGDADMRPGMLARTGRAALAIVQELAGLRSEAPPTAHLGGLLAFLAAHERVPDAAHALGERHLRARSAVLHVLTGLRAAHARVDDHRRPFNDTAAAIRRWVERETFAPRRGSDGAQLVDAQAARFGAFDTVYLVGLTDREWPESTSRSIFYPVSMLADLGWPADTDARASERAAFDDLLRGAGRAVIVSTITLEDDAIVEPSPFLEDLGQGGLTVVREAPGSAVRFTEYDAITSHPIRPDALEPSAASWLGLRVSRSAPDEARYHGQADPVRKTRHKVSAIDQYLACPFAYFATHVLRLEEEPDDEEALGPKAQGRFVHEVLETFFRVWQARGLGAVTADNLEDARALFTETVDARLPSLGETDAALLRTRLLGSPVAPGFGDVVLLAEACRDRGVAVVDRLMEFSLDGPTTLRAGGGTRDVPLAAKADRVDLFADGTFRVIDYKLSKAPDKKHVVQLPAYAAAARQRLEGHLGRSWRAADAAYVAFGKGGQVAPLASNAAQLDAALAEGEARLAAAVDRIERGEFPPTPAEPHRCTYCPYSAVCRKDYVDGE